MFNKFIENKKSELLNYVVRKLGNDDIVKPKTLAMKMEEACASVIIQETNISRLLGFLEDMADIETDSLVVTPSIDDESLDLRCYQLIYNNNIIIEFPTFKGLMSTLRSITLDEGALKEKFVKTVKSVKVGRKTTR